MLYEFYDIDKFVDVQSLLNGNILPSLVPNNYSVVCLFLLLRLVLFVI